MNSKHVLVTGGLGFIGSALVNALADVGYRIDVVDDLSNGNLELIDAPMRKIRNVPVSMLPRYSDSLEVERDESEIVVIYGDFAHDDVLQRITRGTYDIIFHLAANPRVEYTVENPTETTEQNVLKTVALFEIAAKSKTRVVFASSSAVYGDVENLPTRESQACMPSSPYALQKLVGEQFARLFSELYGLDIACLRFFNVYGPGQSGSSPYSTAISAWCDKVASGIPLRSDGDGSQSRDMVFVGDVVDACILAGKREEPFKGDVFNIATGISYTNNEILENFRARFPDLEVTTATWRAGDVMHTLADTTRSKKELGYEAKVSLSEGLTTTWEWWEFEELL